MLHGLPKAIYSDGNHYLMIIIWQELLHWLDIEMVHDMSHHPQLDGWMEIMRKWMESYLQIYETGYQEAWLRWLLFGEYGYHPKFQIGMFHALQSTKVMQQQEEWLCSLLLREYGQDISFYISIGVSLFHTLHSSDEVYQFEAWLCWLLLGEHGHHMTFHM